MNAERYERVVAIFGRACELEGGEREAYLARACDGDGELLDDVLTLLARDAEGETPLERAAEAAARLLQDEPETEEATPERIGGYRVLGRLGAGGMGVVYEAEQESPRRRVALKLVHPGRALNRHLARFEFEAEVLGRLSHPGIARIFEAGTAATQWGELPFFAMELVRGPDLVTWCERRDLDTRARVRLVIDVCRALEHAHGKGVIHRDIKPANVLVQEDGQLKVVDFGVARLTGDGREAGATLTGEGQLVGTLAYSSPEQVRGDSEALDARTDVYSMGVLAYELLCGSLPYDLAGRSLGEVARTVEEVDPTPLGSREPALRGDLETILAKALAKDPERRYASASALASDLGRFLNHETIVARPATSAYRLRKFARRNRLVFGATVAVLLAFASATVVSAMAFVREAQARSLAVDEEARARIEAETAGEVTDFLITMFEASSPGSRGVYPSAEEILAYGSEQIAVSLQDRPVVRARLLHTIGRVYLRLGFHVNAEPLLEEALELRRELGEEYAVELADTLEQLGGLSLSSGNLERALELELESLDLRLAHAPDDAAPILDAELNLALIHMFRREDERAHAYVEAAAARAQTLEDPRVRAKILAQRGVVLDRLGRGDEGLAASEEAVRLIREVAPGSPDEVRLLQRLGNVQLGQGRYERSVETLQAAVDLARALYPEGSLLRAQSETTLADALSQAGRMDESETILIRVRDQLDARYGPEHPHTLRAHGSLADATQDLGRYDEALALYAEVLPGFERAFGPDSDGTLAIVNNLALLHKRSGDHQASLDLNRRAWETRVRTRGPSHLLTLNSKRKVGVQMGLVERHGEALTWLHQTRAECAEHLGPDHAETANCALNVSEILARTGRRAEAIVLLKEALATLETETSRGRGLADWMAEDLRNLEQEERD